MIDRSSAIDIAHKRAAGKSWPFTEPLDVFARRKWFSDIVVRYSIETNSGKRGTKARFVIDTLTGEILEEGYISR